jgi:hypothetical protein
MKLEASKATRTTLCFAFIAFLCETHTQLASEAKQLSSLPCESQGLRLSAQPGQPEAALKLL